MRNAEIPRKISVVTVCRNSAKSIADTIESVASQNFAGLEYIIIDGASNDGTQDVVLSFADLIDTFISEPDRGISDAFNKGITHATGSIVGLINSDDALLPETLQRIWRYFQENPDVQVLHGDVLYYEGDYFIKRVKPTYRWWYPWRMVLFNHPATFVRRDAYEKHGKFDTTYKFAMDDDLFCRWLNAGVRIEYLPEPLVKVRAGGVSGRFAFSVFGEKRRALLENGFQRIPTEIQYISRVAGQFVVMLQKALRGIASR